MSGKNIQDIQALQDLKVLDLTRVVAGPYAGSILGDFGAQVLKIEIPGRGDDARAYGPYENGESMYYANLNRNKKPVIADERFVYMAFRISGYSVADIYFSKHSIRGCRTK